MFGRSKEKVSGRQQRTSEESYLRSKRPVRVRPGLRAWAYRALRWGLAVVLVTAVGFSVAHALETYLDAGPRFQLRDEGLRVTGLRYLSPARVERVLAADIGSSVASIPLEERRQELSGIDWVARASVLRIWPNRLWVHINERHPIGFVRISGGKHTTSTRLVDGEGIFLDPPPGAAFSLPVITGIGPSMPLAERQKRLALFERLISEMDSGDPPYSPLLSEIDISDLRNVRTSTLHGSDIIDLQMGDDQFRHRYALFLKYVDGWKKEFGKVRAVDLRFEGQVAVR
jgi:cell division protein FtsQ